MSVPIQIPESRFADLDGPVHYAEWEGPPERTMVLVHGLGGSLLSWLAVAPGLARHGRVFALDLIGFGQTPRAGRRSRLSDNRALVSRFVREVAGGGPVVLFGNSMGGAISMLEATLELDMVDGLVLTDSVYPWARGSAGRLSRSSRPAPIVMFGFGLYAVPRVGEFVSRQRINRLEAERAVRLGFKISASDHSRIDAELVRAHVEQLVRHQRDPDPGAAFLEAARSLMALGRRPGLARWIMDGVKAPVLAIHGREDRLVPVGFAEAALLDHPEWEMRLLPRVGHVPQMEVPDRWLQAVGGWLSRLPEPVRPPN